MKIKLINAMFLFLCLTFSCSKKFYNKTHDQHLKINNTKKIILNSRNHSNSSSTQNKTKINFNSKKYSSFIIEAPKDKQTGFINFKLRNVNNTISVGILQNRFTIASNKFLHLSSNHNFTNITGNRISINSIHSKDQVFYQNVSQWRLIIEDSFKEFNDTNGWSFKKISKCSQLNLLGGHCMIAKKEISRELSNLPVHSEIRIEANFHFTGKWDNNSAFMRVKDKDSLTKILWTDTCKNSQNSSRKNQMCGYSICKLNSIINVSFPHKKKELNVVFGTDMDNDKPCETSYAISNFRVFVR